MSRSTSTRPASCRTSPSPKPTRCSRPVRFLSYLPQNVWEAPPRLPPEDDPERREEELLSLIPRNSRRIYNPRRLLELVLDRDSFFEIQPEWAAPGSPAWPASTVIRSA